MCESSPNTVGDYERKRRNMEVRAWEGKRKRTGTGKRNGNRFVAFVHASGRLCEVRDQLLLPTKRTKTQLQQDTTCT